MDPMQAIILALIQGLTEFLPISSSGHLILPQTLLGWQDQGLAFDVAVHIGSLVAVLSYFRRDVLSLLSGWSSSVIQRREVGESRLAWLVILATIPAVLAGLLFNDVIEQHFRSAAVLATTTLVFGLLLGLGDYTRRENRRLSDIGIGIALLIGLAQAIALVPGTSRSGITITAALLLGLGRADAARFSFLLSMPIIAAAGCYKLLELLQSSAPVEWGNLALGFAVSALSAYLCITAFMQWIERVGMMPFVIYRIILAAVIVMVAMP